MKFFAKKPSMLGPFINRVLPIFSQNNSFKMTFLLLVCLCMITYEEYMHIYHFKISKLIKYDNSSQFLQFGFPIKESHNTYLRQK